MVFQSALSNRNNREAYINIYASGAGVITIEVGDPRTSAYVLRVSDTEAKAIASFLSEEAKESRKG